VELEFLRAAPDSELDRLRKHRASAFHTKRSG
jgi:hypothetical protein